MGGIASGEYPPGSRLPSEAQLAGSFDTSRLTVNRALRELQLAGIIERRAGSGSYALATPNSRYTFGLLIPELGQTEIFEPICRGMAKVQKREHHALLWGQSLASGEDQRNAANQLVASKVSGVFLAPLAPTEHNDVVNKHTVDVLERARVPIVLLDRDLLPYPARSNYDLVGIDNRRAGYTITRHLLRQGCTRLVFVRQPTSAGTSRGRMAGFLEALVDVGLPCSSERVCSIRASEPGEVARLWHDVRPDGIICTNDITAANMMKALRELGVRIPDDVRITGIDDVKYAALLPVPLTTIRQPCEEMGAAAVATMVQRLANRTAPPRDVLVDFELVVRESCGSASRTHREGGS